MTGALWQSSFVAALFAIHPLHVESVAWVAERKDVLSTFFMMLTVWAYIHYVEKKGVKRYLLVVLFFVLGLMSKPMLVTLPFILLMLDYWPLGRLNFVHGAQNLVTVQHADESSNVFRLIWEKVPLFTLAVASSVATVIVQKSGGAVGSLQIYSLKTRIINTFVAYIEYMVKMVWPVKLVAVYPHPGNSLLLWKGAVAALVLVIITTVVIWKARKIPYIAVGWFWYIVTLIPVIGIVQVGVQAIADRYTYITIIGLFVVIAWGANELLSKLPHRKKLLGVLSAVLFSILMGLTWKQVQYWENSITLFEHTLKHTSNNFLAHTNMGNALYKRGHAQEAIKHYLKALRIHPNFALAHTNLSAALIKQGRTEEAIEHCLQALRIKPDYALAHYNIGLALIKRGRIEEAIEHCLQALRIKPDYMQAHNNLALLFLYKGDTKEAIVHFRKALNIDPENINVKNNLNKALMVQQR
ncbi:MAG: tetratricopeptide repeat protein [Ignavibacteriae bacterium]|nr:tetratricopeptide repeat protein [Ignavibacteriota bacterium]